MRAGIEWLDFSVIPKRTNLELSPEVRHRIRFNSLVLVSAPCRHEVDFELLELHPGEMLFIRSGASLAFSSTDPLQGVGIVFSDSAAEALALMLPADPRFALRTHARRSLRRILSNELFAQLQEACTLLRKHLEHPGDAQAARLLAAFVLTIALGESEDAAPTRAQPASSAADAGRLRDAERFRLFVRRVESDPANSRCVSRHAAALGMSPGRLNLLVKRMSGVTAKRWVDEALLLEAQRRLATEDCSVDAIAMELGFSEATHFVKFFSRMSGMTPGAFRQSKRKTEIL